MGFSPLHSILANRPLRPALNAARIVSIAAEVVGNRGRALTFARGILRVNVPTSVAAAQLKAQEEDLIHQINARLGKPLISKLRYRVGE